MSDQQTVIVDFVKGLVEVFDLEATFEASADEEEISINVVGDDLGASLQGVAVAGLLVAAVTAIARMFDDDQPHFSSDRNRAVAAPVISFPVSGFILLLLDGRNAVGRILVKAVHPQRPLNADHGAFHRLQQK